MSHSRKPLLGLVLTTTIAASTLVASPPARAADAPTVGQSVDVERTPSSKITVDTMRQAIAEARDAGAVLEERISPDGTLVAVVATEEGASFELAVPTRGDERLSAGSDSYGGMFVGFNAFDQNLIISGAMTAIAAGMCALGPAVCAVANVAAVLASAAIGSSGGVRCGTKSLRVYPVSRKAPRCA